VAVGVRHGDNVAIMYPFTSARARGETTTATTVDGRWWRGLATAARRPFRRGTTIGDARARTHTNGGRCERERPLYMPLPWLLRLPPGRPAVS